MTDSELITALQAIHDDETWFDIAARWDAGWRAVYDKGGEYPKEFTYAPSLREAMEWLIKTHKEKD